MPQGIKAQIDPLEVEKLAKWGLTNCEIADFFGVNEGTIRRRFPKNIVKGRHEMKLALRKMMWRAAQGTLPTGSFEGHPGNVTAMIWLSKNLLGWSEKVEQKIEQQQAIKLKWNAADNSP